MVFYKKKSEESVGYHLVTGVAGLQEECSIPVPLSLAMPPSDTRPGVNVSSNSSIEKE